MRSRIHSIALVALVLILAAAPAVRSAPPLPLSLYGAVQINGADVPAGTVIRAWCAGAPYVETVTFTYQGHSVYTIDVPGDDPDQSGKQGCYGGASPDTVMLAVDGLIADQTIAWVSGSSVELNLSALRPLPQLALEKRTQGLVYRGAL